ncbi:MAG: MmcQ/YjbR family DNA-binding protein [Oscillospiraceae bacterium]|nr:MmcQ/YjbR family DNA-binding protein [Oscillospiraceae bacterium]
MTIEEVKDYVRDRFGAEAEYLWARFPEAFIFRHDNNRKWFAVAIDTKRKNLGLTGDEIVFVLDVKIGPLLSGSYLGKPGVIPAWHMNKTHWLGVLPDCADEETVKELLEISWELTR